GGRGVEGHNGPADRDRGPPARPAQRAGAARESVRFLDEASRRATTGENGGRGARRVREAPIGAAEFPPDRAERARRLERSASGLSGVPVVERQGASRTRRELRGRSPALARSTGTRRPDRKVRRRRNRARRRPPRWLAARRRR